jgi:3',5'-cyclic AMP phosphodiesterase CpdA
MKKYFILLSFVYFFESAQAHEGKDHEDLRHWEIASADPDRIFLNFYGDSASTRAVTWRTSKDRDRKAYAEIGKALGGPGFINNLTRIKAKTETIDLSDYKKNDQEDVSYHSVIFKDLEPGTLYAYRVGDGDEHWSEWIQFRTASQKADPFQFVYFGDAQNEVLSHWSRTIRMAYQVAPNAGFALHAGDLINQASVDAEWAEWYKAGGFLHSQWSGIPVAGNHEYAKREKNQKYKNLAMQWRPQFTLPIPPNLPERLHETVYTVEYQGMQIIVLNSNELIEEQTPYLKEQLERPGFRWKVLTFHHSMFSPRRGISKSNELMESEWRPLIEKHNVDLVLQGHDHTYTRSQAPERKGSNFVKDSFQTMYVTTVSGPKQYAIRDEHLEDFKKKGIQVVREGEQTQFFQVISVDENLLTYEAYTSTGELYDAAKITKDFNTGKKVIQQAIPNVKEKTFENTPGTENSHK